MSGRTVKIFLVDGIPGGIITAEIMNWTGKFMVTPRSRLADLAQRDELKRTGIYFLIGSSEDDPTQEIVYIGESDHIWSRLAKHNKEKDFWEKTVIVTSKDENLTKAHTRYLESRLIQIVSKAKRAQVTNGTSPEVPGLPEPDIADMEYFLEQIQMILSVLGFSFANPLPDLKSIHTETTKEVSPTFCMVYDGANALAQEINGEFVVLDGSTARKTHTNSLADSYTHTREKLVKDGILTDSDDQQYWVFTQSASFQSPSAAAMIVAGASANGRTQWKVQGSSQTYASWQEEQIEKAGEVIEGTEED